MARKQRLIHGQAALFTLLAAAALPAQTFTTLAAFDGATGAGSTAKLAQGADGDFYGVKAGGGAGNGTIFKVTPAGALSAFYDFQFTDGALPLSELIQGTDGNFYGTTWQGGNGTGCFNFGCGTIFKITPGGMLTSLYDFNLPGGTMPGAGLVQADDGNFYGTTTQGGIHTCAVACGTIFKMTPGAVVTTLHNFNTTDGADPDAKLTQGRDGNFYGTTYWGGASNACSTGCGTVFKMTRAGVLTTLHSFNLTDGYYPEATVTEGPDGNFYGTTAYGGLYGYGTVYRITPSGTLTTLHHFHFTDGAGPSGELTLATDNNLYGITFSGGTTTPCPVIPHGCGTIFKITTGGVLTTLHQFQYQSEGYGPSSLLQATDGNFYGATYGGGPHNDGSVFSLSVGLGPFVKPVKYSGKVGDTVIILGNNLTGATSVSFNGAAAVFTVVSATEISAIVPSAATSGKIQVVTPGGTLSSGGRFLVLP